MTPSISLRAALADPQLLGNTLSGDSWRPWRTLLIAAMGEPLDDAERTLFKQFTGGREREPGQRVEEFVGVIGRRGGKSRAISTLATYIAGLCRHPSLVRGERGVLLIIAADQKQADICLDYVEATFRASPILAQLIEGRRDRQLRLTNGVSIEVRASDYRTLRGPTYVAVIADEVAFWFNGEASANPDDEILNAVRPGLATTGGPLIMISSPYARRGELWDTYRRHFGANGDPSILVAQGASRDFNPTLSQSVVDRAVERDPAAAGVEYLAQFRTDIESFVNADAVLNNCVIRGLYERPPVHGVQFAAFVDPSGGSADSMTLAVGCFDHARSLVLVSCLREVVPPFNPSSAVEEFVRVLGSYGLDHLVGDRYAGQWPVEAFAKFNVRYEQSARPKSDLYLDLLPLLNSGRIHLLDNAKCVNQICSLERRTARGGRDSIDHPPGGHDDLANSVAGLASVLTQTPSINYQAWTDDTEHDPHGVESWRRFQRNVFYESLGQVIIR
jgi:hypothetical protein